MKRLLPQASCGSLKAFLCKFSHARPFFQDGYSVFEKNVLKYKTVHTKVKGR